VDGGENPITGARNIIPWQRAPEARLEIRGPGEKAGRFVARASWDPVLMPSDRSTRPSEAHDLGTPGHGVGVADLGPLVAYAVERAAVTLHHLGQDGYPATELILWEEIDSTLDTEAEIDLGPDECVRVKVLFGLRPRSRAVSAATCALGRCGDIGYFVTGPPRCLEGPVLRSGAKRGTESLSGK